MKFLIALALLAVVSALPPRHGFGHPHENYELQGPNYHLNKHHQFNLIKLIYNQLIDSLNHPSENDNEEEERAINDIVNTINIMGHIIQDNSNSGDDGDVYNGPSKPQHPEHSVEEGDVPNKPPTSGKEDRSNWHRQEKVPSSDDSEDKVISPARALPVNDENESSEVFVVDNDLDDEEKHDVLSFLNQKDDGEKPIIAYNSIGIAKEVPALLEYNH